VIRSPGAACLSPLAGAVGLLLLAMAALALGSPFGCAHVVAPPGGPPDSIPPLLIAVLPDSFSVVPDFDDKVRFQFDEAISEQGLQNSVVLYPFDPRPRVDKAKRELRVRPREGWVSGRIYHLRVEPVIQDLFNNRIRQPIPYVFSTGAPLPLNAAVGTVFDRITGRPLARGRVDMVWLPDTLRYGMIADSLGAFQVKSLPLGEYLAIGYEDLNNNQRADDFDRSDTLGVRLGSTDTLRLEFHIFRHDTLGPQLTSAKAIDSLIVELSFDGYLHPDSAVSASMVELFALADSTPIELDTVLHNWQYTTWRDSVQAARRAAADTLGAAAGEAQPAAQPAQPPVNPGRRPGAPRPGPPGRQEPTPQETQAPAALPDRRLFVVAAASIPPGTIGVRVRRLFNLSGMEGGSETSYEQPPREEPPPAPEQPPGQGAG